MIMATHNWNYGRLVKGRKVTEESKWGNETAYRRYGVPKYFHGAPQPPDHSQPQDPVDKPDHSGVPRPFNDAANDWKLGAGRGGEGYQNFDDHRPRGAAPRRPKAERPTNPGSGDVNGWLRDGGGSPFSAAKRK
jgi:hypothetical protein